MGAERSEPGIPDSVGEGSHIQTGPIYQDLVESLNKASGIKSRIRGKRTNCPFCNKLISNQFERHLARCPRVEIVS